jgi:hypothetical protein
VILANELAAATLAEIGDSAVHYLIGSLHDHDTKRREAAVWLAGRVADPRLAAPLVSDLLDDPETSVRVAAAVALGAIGTAETVEPLVAAGRDAVNQVRDAAEVSLGQLTDPEALGLLHAIRSATVEAQTKAPVPAPRAARHVLVVCPGTLFQAEQRARLSAAFALDSSVGVSGVAAVYTHGEGGRDVIRAEVERGVWTDVVDLDGSWLLFCPEDTLSFVKADRAVMRVVRLVDAATWEGAEDKARLLAGIGSDAG